ncbi:MAG TPA: S41 family peptidase [Pyrinomonadaceae bacterium]|jgi:hypothetical protein
MIEKTLDKQQATSSLADWLDHALTALGPEERCEAIVEQAIALLEQACVHIPFISSESVDPVERLKLLRSNLPETREGFYCALLNVFALFGDRHTSCQLPEPFADSVAFLPFLVREFFDQGEHRLCVVASGHDELRPGDTLLSWNDHPGAEAINQHMTRQLGANSEARRAKAVQTLTYRQLSWLPPPAEDVSLESLGRDGRVRKVRLAWQVAEAHWLARSFSSILREKNENDAQLPANLRSRLVESSLGTFGYIRIASFQEQPGSFLRSFITALDAMPSDGLILDLRGCEEGIIPTAERLLQLFTTQTVEPLPFQFRLSPLIRRLVNNCPALSEWREPVERADRRGEAFSECLPLTSVDEANGAGRRYHGPVVLLTDALTYSSAEMFAAGFQDHGLGPILGTAARTGGGGASAWHQKMIFKLSEDEAFRPLPLAPVYRVAVRRCLRVRAMSGKPLERVGLTPDAFHQPTRRDLLEDDAELFERAAKILAENRNRRYI